ncbi:MAG: phosphoribosylamine---glycine ligase [Sphingomonadales bacterium]|jgi:phosphoribosylamine--glycine ligase|nr:phosphoribosylamine---glycine ligase [Sphingomonadales bacterium]
MRFLGVTETCDLGALYLRLQAEGHEVRIAVTEPLAEGTLAGLVPRARAWRAELDWVREVGAEGIILFEAVSEGFGALQDDLRRQGFNVIGGSAFGDRLENDRAFAQALLAQLGFPRGHIWEFSDGAAADAFLAANPGRYVLKFSGPDFESSDNYVGQLEDGADVRAMLRAKLPRRGAGATFILMRHIAGIEMGVGAYFDGRKFLRPACLDWEHKRFFAGDMGELTGEMGTVATYDRSGAFFERTLAGLEPHLREAGHVGYVNLNTIVNEEGIWPLELTSRFGYPGFAVLDPIQKTSWARLLAMMASGSGHSFETVPGFSVGVLLTTPPFPYSRKQVDAAVGLPIFFSEPFDLADWRNVHFGEIGKHGDGYVTSGLYGWTMVVTGVAATIREAQRLAYRRLGRILVPDGRYRLDIGDRLTGGELERLERLGLLDPPAPA